MQAYDRYQASWGQVVGGRGGDVKLRAACRVCWRSVLIPCCEEPRGTGGDDATAERKCSMQCSMQCSTQCSMSPVDPWQLTRLLLRRRRLWRRRLCAAQVCQPGNGRHRLKGKIAGPEFNKLLQSTCGFVCARTRKKSLARYDGDGRGGASVTSAAGLQRRAATQRSARMSLRAALAPALSTAARYQRCIA